MPAPHKLRIVRVFHAACVLQLQIILLLAATVAAIHLHPASGVVLGCALEAVTVMYRGRATK